jgi:ApaG protein
MTTLQCNESSVLGSQLRKIHMEVFHGSECVTDGIRVQVEPHYMREESDPDERRFVFAYQVMIRNEGSDRVKLVSRKWVVIDADGDRNEVRGPGVVGYTPVLGPGDEFEYVSHCPLETPWGTMEGEYCMQREDGEEFQARIGRFYLVASEADAEAL